MIFNGHNTCIKNKTFRFIFNNFYISAGQANNQKYARSLYKHIWTFDDGHIDQLKQIYYDYFKPEGLVFQFFICPKLIDEWEIGNSEYVRSQLRDPNAELLSWDQIGNLIDAGNIIGSHGIDHESFSGMSCNMMSEQLESSKEMIKKRTGITPNTFAFPYGYVSPSSIEASRAARKEYLEVHLSDNNLPIGEIENGIFNRRHSEFGICVIKGLFIGALDVILGINVGRLKNRKLNI